MALTVTVTLIAPVVGAEFAVEKLDHIAARLLGGTLIQPCIVTGPVIRRSSIVETLARYVLVSCLPEIDRA